VLTLLACALGVALVAPTVMALLALSSESGRELIFGNVGFLVFNLSGLLNVSNPAHRSVVLHFEGYRLLNVPVTYIGWFILPLLPFVAWSRAFFREKLVVCWAVFAAVLLLLTQGPDRMGPLRDPSRWLVMAQMAIIVLAAMAYSRLGWRSEPRSGHLAAALAIAAAGLFLGLASDPAAWRPAVLTGLIVVSAVTLIYFLLRRQPMAAFGIIAVVSIAALGYQRVTYQTYFGPASWGGLPDQVDARPADLGSVPTAYGILLDSWGTLEPERFREIGVGNLNLMFGNATIGGYDSIERAGFVAATCFSVFGYPMPRCGIGETESVIPRLLRPSDDLGVSLLDLMRVDAIFTYRREIADAIARVTGPTWKRVDGQYSQSLRRALPAALPGTVSYVSKGVTIRETRPASVRQETYEIDASGVVAPQVVWARMAWPGYRVMLDGVRLKVEHRDGFLVAVRLPDNAKGSLTLAYRPRALSTGLAISGIALLLLIGVLVLRRTWQGR
jgi:hypothetical protein